MHPACFSVDVEDWYHSELLPTDHRHGHGESVVGTGVLRLLEILERHRARATFFVLGHVVQDHPELVQRIVAEGHELGCHGWDHTPLWRLDREGLRRQLRDFRREVEAVLGGFPVRGFRAPVFSLEPRTAWALEVLRGEGYDYDSSVFPLKVMMYGVAGAPLGIYRPGLGDLARHDPAGPLVEFPVAIGGLGPLRFPAAGGFYLRALPFALFDALFQRVRRERPAALYLHPRECAPEAARLPLGPYERFITYAGLETVGAKLERLLSRGEWLTMAETLEAAGHLAPGAGTAPDAQRRA